METRSKKRKQEETSSTRKQPETEERSSKRAKGATKESASAKPAKPPTGGASGSTKPSKKPRSTRGGRASKEEASTAPAPTHQIAPPALPASAQPEQPPMDRAGRRSSRGDPSDGQQHSSDEVRARLRSVRHRRRASRVRECFLMQLVASHRPALLGFYNSTRHQPPNPNTSRLAQDPGDVFGRNFAGASSALQGLLRKLGAGLEDMMGGGHTGSRIKVCVRLNALRGQTSSSSS